MKKCYRCKEEKELEDFTKSKRTKDGLAGLCRDCSQKSCREYYRDNREEMIAKKAAYHKDNPEVGRKARREYQKRNRKEITTYQVNWRNEKYKSDINFRMSTVARSAVRRVLKAIQHKKNCSALEYLGCSVEDLKIHLESLWKEGMSWENYGKFGWHVDHIIPVSYFSKNCQNPWEANHYTNLQPLWWQENLAKSDKII